MHLSYTTEPMPVLGITFKCTLTILKSNPDATQPTSYVTTTNSTYVRLLGTTHELYVRVVIHFFE